MPCPTLASFGRRGVLARASPAKACEVSARTLRPNLRCASSAMDRLNARYATRVCGRVAASICNVEVLPVPARACTAMVAGLVGVDDALLLIGRWQCGGGFGSGYGVGAVLGGEPAADVADGGGSVFGSAGVAPFAAGSLVAETVATRRETSSVS